MTRFASVRPAGSHPPGVAVFPRRDRADETQLRRGANVSFCSHCGRRSANDGRRPSRICLHCEMGLLLEADPHLAPGPGDAFVVTDGELRICALSQGAERLLCRSEPSVIHQPLSHLLLGVSVDETGVPLLPALLRAAAAGAPEVAETVVASVDGGREHHLARLGCCGPPSAALLVIEGSPA